MNDADIVSTNMTGAQGTDAGSGVFPEVHEACGVFGFVAGPCDVVRTIKHGLVALQHRGQEAAGLAVRLGDGTIAAHKDIGLVRDVFRRLPMEFQNLVAAETGSVVAAIGHVRYATAGGLEACNSQPFVIATAAGEMALGHNGHLTNATEVRRLLGIAGATFASDSDSELLAHLVGVDATMAGDGDVAFAAAVAAVEGTPLTPIAARVGDFWLPRIARLMRLARGAWSLTILTPDGLFAVRDPLGLRPLQLGQRDGTGNRVDWFVASESCAFVPSGARLVRDVRPGEIIFIPHEDRGFPISFQVQQPTAIPRRSAFCVFEYVYFARPDSVLEKRPVVAVRGSLGHALGTEAPVQADLVVGVPDSALPAARAYAAAVGLPFEDVFMRNHFAGRSFIEPTPELRETAVRLKFSLVGKGVAGLRVVLVDDSLVRGTTARALVALLREAGAREVHLRIASGPVVHPCRMGVDMASRNELVAAGRGAAELGVELGADSLVFLSVAAMMRAVHVSNQDVDKTSGHCNACFSGVFPDGVD